MDFYNFNFESIKKQKKDILLKEKTNFNNK